MLRLPTVIVLLRMLLVFLNSYLEMAKLLIPLHASSAAATSAALAASTTSATTAIAASTAVRAAAASTSPVIGTGAGPAYGDLPVVQHFAVHAGNSCLTR